ncbi:copper chaperone PCu(A)C [Meiothermus sp. CFH 77666]|uniref:copper chaperone PCu(A)C n=1 Tax=Meiothermus sp. CFH 77666 TaxID=2817942 RepID=UPI001AA0AE5B|nr:copper chaperone PCu(A)C [Meiothermus sp. CFH 77666]MBO1438730.1 copper chaperone PCu(A)C [Meiothermus sp. CFH 77666]
MRRVFWTAVLGLGLALEPTLAQHQHGDKPAPPETRTATGINLGVQNGWVRLSPPTLKDTTAYMTLTNPTVWDLRLVGGSTPVAEMVMLMSDYKEVRGGQTVQGMRAVKFLTLPQKGRLELIPGGQHLMLMGLKRALREGDRIPIRLLFEGNLEARIELRVERR